MQQPIEDRDGEDLVAGEVHVCPACASAMRIVAFVTAQKAVRRILAHLERRAIDARAGPWADAAA